MAATTDPLEAVTAFSYDRNGNPASVTDALDNSAYYAYDELDRLEAVTDALENAEYYTYDAVSNLTTFKDASGGETDYVYDLADQRTSVVYPDATFNYFGYDAASNLTEAQDSRGWTYFAYDRTNRLLSDKAPDTSETTHAYDASSNRTRVTSPASSAYYTYNAADRMTQAKSNEADVGSADYGYDAAGNLTAKELGNGAHTYFAYDADNRVTSIKNCLPDGSALAYFNYTYDAAGRITNVIRADDTDVYYTYDNADRLTGEKWQASGGSTLYAFTWDYDAAGNRTYESTADAQSYYTYDAANELTLVHELPATGTYFYYDARGNCEKIQKTGGTTYFQYNDVNLVTEIKYPGDVMNYFAYDAMLRRYAVKESTGVSYFTWDDNDMDLLCERDASGSVTAYYTHGFTGVDGIGSLVSAKHNEAGASYYQYPVYNIHGDVVRLLDDNGTPTAYFEYDAWGTPLETNVVGGTGTNRFRYQSNWIELKDSNGDLYLSPTRLYHAGVGRFLGRDPEHGLAGGYDYAYSSPTTKVDPTGGPVKGLLGKIGESCSHVKTGKVSTPPTKPKRRRKRKSKATTLSLEGLEAQVATLYPHLNKKDCETLWGIWRGARILRRLELHQKRHAAPEDPLYLLPIPAVAKLVAWHRWAYAMWENHGPLSGQPGDYRYHDDVVRGMLLLWGRADRVWTEELKRRRRIIRGDKCCCKGGDWTLIYTGGAGAKGGAGLAAGASIIFWEATCKLEKSKKIYGRSVSGVVGVGYGAGFSGGLGKGIITNMPSVEPGSLTLSSGYAGSIAAYAGGEGSVQWSWSDDSVSATGGPIAGGGGIGGVVFSANTVTSVKCD